MVAQAEMAGARMQGAGLVWELPVLGQVEPGLLLAWGAALPPPELLSLSYFLSRMKQTAPHNEINSSALVR